MSRDRPINADAPADWPPAPASDAPQPAPEPKPAPQDAPAPAPAPPSLDVKPDADAVVSGMRNKVRSDRGDGGDGAASGGGAAAGSGAAAEGAAPPRRARRRVPGALKLVGGLVALAVLFIVVAIVGGTGGGDDGDDEAPAPTPVAAPPREEEPRGGEEAAAELGFPAFATGNTTRVGGSDPAAVAAAVALAVFPSVEPSQRPRAVTLVGEDDWAGAIAGAVLMAPPVRAPLLYSSRDGLPEPTAEALSALQPAGGDGSPAVFAIGPVAAPSGTRSVRVRGGGPAAVAARVAALRDRLVGSPPRHVVVAPQDPRFAAPAAAWAARSGDPVLFSGPRKLPAATAKAIRRHPKAPVFVLGPSSAISSDVVREIAALGPPVKRVAGEDPVTNALAFARYASGDFGWNVNDPGHGFVVARADAPLLAAAAAPLSASGTWGPLLLTDGAEALPPELRSYFLDVKPGYRDDPTRAFYNHVWVIGDEDAIGVAQQAELHELAELAKIRGDG